MLANTDLFVELCECEVPGHRYFSSMACLSNCLREFSSRCRSMWIQLFPFYPGISHFANQLPPRCIHGLWGAILSFELYILNRPWNMLSSVMRSVFGVEQEEQEDLSRIHIDPESREESKQYKLKTGRWRTTALAIVKCQRFHLVTRSVTKVHEILGHIQHFLMSDALDNCVMLGFPFR